MTRQSVEELIEGLRKKLDKIDNQLLGLLQTRVNVAKEIGALKKEHGLVYHVPERERHVLERLTELNDGSQLSSKSLQAVFREIMSACLSVESPLRLAFVAESIDEPQELTKKLFGESTLLQAYENEKQLFNALDEQLCDYAMVPLTDAGLSIGRTLEALMDSYAVVHLQVTPPNQTAELNSARFGVFSTHKHFSPRPYDKQALIAKISSAGVKQIQDACQKEGASAIFHASAEDEAASLVWIECPASTMAQGPQWLAELARVATTIKDLGRFPVVNV